MANYKEKIDQMVWSYSRLTTFAQCKYAFYLRYIVSDDEEYLPESNYYAEVGLFVHEILAMIFNGELSADDAAQYFVDHYDENIFHKTKKDTMETSFELCADYFAEVDFSWINEFEILGVEMEIETKISGYRFKGFIDLLLKEKTTNRIILIDHKSSKPFLKPDGTAYKNTEKSFNSYKKQMYLYAHVVKELFGSYPDAIAWNHYKYGKFSIIPFDQNEYDNAIAWFINTIHMVEKEESFDENIDYFYCTNLCDFRNCCEYKSIRKHG